MCDFDLLHSTEVVPKFDPLHSSEVIPAWDEHSSTSTMNTSFRSSPLTFPRFSPARTPRRGVTIDSDLAAPDPGPLAFPSSPVNAPATPVKNRFAGISILPFP